MNKIKQIHLALSLICTTGVWAKGVEIEGIYYILDDNNFTAEVTYTGAYYNSPNTYTGYISIPSVVTYDENTYSVTIIGSSAFCACTELTSIDLPNSVTTIGDYAFSGCVGLTSIDIPNSV